MLDLLFGLIGGLILGRYLERKRYDKLLQADEERNSDDLDKSIKSLERTTKSQHTKKAKKLQ